MTNGHIPISVFNSDNPHAGPLGLLSRYDGLYPSKLTIHSHFTGNILLAFDIESLSAMQEKPLQ